MQLRDEFGCCSWWSGSIGFDHVRGMAAGHTEEQAFEWLRWKTNEHGSSIVGGLNRPRGRPMREHQVCACRCDYFAFPPADPHEKTGGPVVATHVARCLRSRNKTQPSEVAHRWLRTTRVHDVHMYFP